MGASKPGLSWARAVVTMCLLVAGCGDDGLGPGRVDLVVTTATTGIDVDPGGYTVVVEGLGSRSIGPSASVTFEGVPGGNYLVELTGIPQNCSLAGQNPREVSAGSGLSLDGRFEVTCVPNLGAIAVTVSSSGTDVPDTYRLTVDGGVSRSVDADGTILLESVPAREVAAALTMPANCVLEGGNPKMVTVPFGDVVAATFEVSCSPDQGAVEVITSTSGNQPDPDGYTAVVDGTMDGSVGVNDAVILDLVPAGARTVELTDVAANCVVVGNNPRTVAVAFGDTVSTTFEVQCDPNGDVQAGVQTTGMNIPSAFTAVADGSLDLTVGPNETVVFEDLPPGDHVIELTDVPANCEVVGENPRTVTVTGGIGSTTFVVECWAFLVYDSDRDGNSDVIIMRHDGSDQRNLTAASDSYDGQPVVSPDGTKIAFASTRSGTEHIYVMNRNGSGVVQMTFTGEVNKEPSWSRDGSKIVFSRRESGQFDVWMMDANGSNPVNLTNDPAFDARGELSPDGTKLLFDSTRDGTRNIWVRNLGTGVDTQLTTEGGANPTWSTDGSKITFTALRPNVKVDIWIMNQDGSSPTNLTNRPLTSDGESAWSPDGTRIAFSSSRDGNAEIYLMDPDGTNVERVTVNGSEDLFPSWSP